MTILSRRLTGLAFAGVFLGFSVSAYAFSPSSSAETGTEIRRTGFGVPHIRAQDERGLGFGIGYAYAQDNLCLLANEIVTVNGLRSRYFGPDQVTVEARPNRVSDVFFTWLNPPKQSTPSGRRNRPRCVIWSKVTLPAITTISPSDVSKACRSNVRVSGCAISPRQTWSS